MSKVITFSRTFPAYHPRKGEPTYFVEAILTELGINYKTGKYFKWLVDNNPKISGVFLVKFFDSLKRDIDPKKHTIRAHKRPLKVGEYINPHCWAGKPYNKTEEGFWQIKFAPDIEIKKVWDFEMDLNGVYSINGKYILSEDDDATEIKLAKNDGFDDPADLFNWFMPNFNKPKHFTGQILCWSDSVNY